MTEQIQKFESFQDFYPFYLAEHQNKTCRRLHFVGSTLVLATLIYILSSGNLRALAILPILGYGFAWIGHFVFEKNRPATFKYPFYSFLGDWVMYRDILMRKISW